MKEITDKKIDTDNLVPQTLKSRLLIPDYDCDKDVVVKKYVESKTFLWRAFPVNIQTT